GYVPLDESLSIPKERYSYIQQICLIILISAAILIPTVTPIPKAAAQVEIYYVLLANEEPVHSIDVFVCQDFGLEFLIDLPQGVEMVEFDALIEWNPEQVELKSYELAEWVGGTVNGELEEGSLTITGKGPAIFQEEWARLIFHCLGPGKDKIVAHSPPKNTVWIDDGTPTPYVPTPWDVYVNQYTTPPPRVSHPVGGAVYPVNKLVVLVPYIALIGLASLAAAAAKRLRR
ncbi:MAG: hypothetical protein QW390_02400, partial [Candidatus Bathyarchaeia archaeon]